MEREMRSAAVCAKLIDYDSMVISRHWIVRVVNFGTYVQCSCGAFVIQGEWNRHITRIIEDRSERIEDKEES